MGLCEGVRGSACSGAIIGRHPREGGDPGFRFKHLKSLVSRLRGNDGSRDLRHVIRRGSISERA
ncbi:hypothetical protein FZ029_21375 [Azospirillum sp. Sh1]|nr:hypothetical protein FZ029_21375 [Azospirillum sp. Sh1]